MKAILLQVLVISLVVVFLGAFFGSAIIYSEGHSNKNIEQRPFLKDGALNNIGARFEESGLKSGDVWAITIYFNNNTSKSYTSMQSGICLTQPNINVSLANGTYQYRVGMEINEGPGFPTYLTNINTGYVILPNHGEITVNDNLVSIPITFVPITQYNVSKIGGTVGSTIITGNTSLTSNFTVKGNLTIDNGATLYTNGFYINVLQYFINHGNVVAGWSYNQGNDSVPNAPSYPLSYGGSGGGADSHNFSRLGGSGGNTNASGGAGTTDSDAYNGATAHTPFVNYSVVANWLSNNISQYLVGAGGGFAYGWGALNGGSGSYGIFIRAYGLIAGNISAAGLSSTNNTNVSNGGAGGGGVILLSYGQGGYVQGNYSVSGGRGISNSQSYSGGASGGNGQVISFYSAFPFRYLVTFVESGLQNVLWYVIFNGTEEYSSGTTISFYQLNGTYSYTIKLLADYNFSPSSGQVSINGANVSVNITFTSPPTPTPSNFNMLTSLLFGPFGIVLFFVACVSIMALIKRIR
jgi:hypothetical protein